MEKAEVSTIRLRIGVFFIFLWWFPFWAAAPAVARWIGTSNVSRVTMTIMIIQTLVGLLGFFVAGKQVSTLFKQMPFKKVPGAIWRVLINGKM